MIIPTRPRWLSLLTLLFGIVVFLWLSVEDNGWWVAVYGVVGSLILTAQIALRLANGYTLTPRSLSVLAMLTGMACGGGGVVITVLLMLMKTSLHGHLYPDYTFPLIFGMVQRLPAWGLAGGLIGLAGALVVWK